MLVFVIFQYLCGGDFFSNISKLLNWIVKLNKWAVFAYGGIQGSDHYLCGGFQNDQILIKYLIWGSVHLLWGHLSSSREWPLFMWGHLSSFFSKISKSSKQFFKLRERSLFVMGDIQRSDYYLCGGSKIQNHHIKFLSWGSDRHLLWGDIQGRDHYLCGGVQKFQNDQGSDQYLSGGIFGSIISKWLNWIFKLNKSLVFVYGSIQWSDHYLCGGGLFYYYFKFQGSDHYLCGGISKWSNENFKLREWSLVIKAFVNRAFK